MTSKFFMFDNFVFKVLESSISRIKFCSTVRWWLMLTSVLIKTVAVISIHTAHFTVLVGKSSTLFLYSSQVYTDAFYLILIESYAKNYNILAHIQQSSHSHCYAESFSTQWQKARNFHHQCTSTHRFEFLLLNRKTYLSKVKQCIIWIVFNATGNKRIQYNSKIILNYLQDKFQNFCPKSLHTLPARFDF